MATYCEWADDPDLPAIDPTLVLKAGLVLLTCGLTVLSAYCLGLVVLRGLRAVGW